MVSSKCNHSQATHGTACLLVLGMSCHDVAVLIFATRGSYASIFFAIFDHYPKWQWGSLPEKYCENPHLSLDREHVFADFTKYKSGEDHKCYGW